MDSAIVSEAFSQRTFTSEDVNKQFMVTFYGRELGIVSIDNAAKATWSPLNIDLCSILSRSKYADMPAMIYNIHPSQSIIGFLLNAKTRDEYYRTHFKALSNIRFFHIDGYHTTYAFRNIAQDIDRLSGSIDEFIDKEGVLRVKYSGPVGTVGLERLPFSILKAKTTMLDHRISGNESKLFGHLSRAGKLQLSDEGRGFTHFIKLGEAGGRESHPLMEWMGLELMRHIGLPTTEAALMKVDDQCSPALIVERFDIPNRSEISGPKKLIQDFYTIFGRDPQDDSKDRHITYQQLIKDFIGFTKSQHPSEQERMVKLLLTRIVAAWAMSDEDLHSKNLSILMNVDLNNPENSTYDMSPAYDGHINIACGSQGASMLYKLHDKMNGGAAGKINLNDFVNLFKNPELSVNGNKFCIFDTAEEVQQFVRDISSKCAFKAAELVSNPPSFISGLRYGKMYLQDMRLGAAIVIERAKAIGADYPKDFEYTGIFGWAKKYGPKARSAALGGSARTLNKNDPNDKVLLSTYRKLLSEFEVPQTRLQSNKELGLLV